MKSVCRTKTLQALHKQMKSGKICLTHKLQRQEQMWKSNDKALLIDSLLRNYPINPTYAVVESDIFYVIDGVQRLSTVRDFLDNQFALSKDLEPVVIDEKEYIIAGKKFKKLDEEIRDIILASELQIYELYECNDINVREIFARQNNGKPLSNTQKRSAIESEELSAVVNELKSHPFFQKVLTANQRKKDIDKDIIREVLMLVESNKEFVVNSFKTKDINLFIQYYNDKIDREKIDVLIASLTKLDESFEEMNTNVLSLPMIIYGMYWCVKSKKSVTKYVEWLKSFIDNYDSNEEYKQYCVSATNSKENVQGRFEYFKKALKTI